LYSLLSEEGISEQTKHISIWFNTELEPQLRETRSIDMEPMEGRHAHSIPNISEAYLKRADLCGTHLNMGGEKHFFRERYFLCNQVGKAGSSKIS
jgi:hypothetical protein